MLEGVEFFEDVLQVVELLAGFGEFAFRGQPLIVREVLACLGDERLVSAAGWIAGGLRRAGDGCGRGASVLLSVEDSEPKREASAASKVGA